MKKKIYLMAQILQNNNPRDFIPKSTKKKSKYQAPKKGNLHALVVIHSSLDAWIVYSSASHHMETTNDILSSIIECTGPPILMGDDSLVDVIKKGRVELDHISFENVLHIPQIFMNMILVYQITHSGSSKKLEFTPESVSILTCKTTLRLFSGR
jgi:hypothetical protein